MNKVTLGSLNSQKSRIGSREILLLVVIAGLIVLFFYQQKRVSDSTDKALTISSEATNVAVMTLNFVRVVQGHHDGEVSKAFVVKTSKEFLLGMEGIQGTENLVRLMKEDIDFLEQDKKIDFMSPDKKNTYNSALREYTDWIKSKFKVEI